MLVVTGSFATRNISPGPREARVSDAPSPDVCVTQHQEHGGDVAQQGVPANDSLFNAFRSFRFDLLYPR